MKKKSLVLFVVLICTVALFSQAFAFTWGDPSVHAKPVDPNGYGRSYDSNTQNPNSISRMKVPKPDSGTNLNELPSGAMAGLCVTLHTIGGGTAYTSGGGWNYFANTYHDDGALMDGNPYGHGHTDQNYYFCGGTTVPWWGQWSYGVTTIQSYYYVQGVLHPYGPPHSTGYYYNSAYPATAPSGCLANTTYNSAASGINGYTYYGGCTCAAGWTLSRLNGIPLSGGDTSLINAFLWGYANKGSSYGSPLVNLEAYSCIKN